MLLNRSLLLFSYCSCFHILYTRALLPKKGRNASTVEILSSSQLKYWIVAMVCIYYPPSMRCNSVQYSSDLQPNLHEPLRQREIRKVLWLMKQEIRLLNNHNRGKMNPSSYRFCNTSVSGLATPLQKSSLHVSPSIWILAFAKVIRQVPDPPCRENFLVVAVVVAIFLWL